MYRIWGWLEFGVLLGEDVATEGWILLLCLEGCSVGGKLDGVGHDGIDRSTCCCEFGLGSKLGCCWVLRDVMTMLHEVGTRVATSHIRDAIRVFAADLALNARNVLAVIDFCHRALARLLGGYRRPLR